MIPKFKNNLTVADDQIWRCAVANELRSQIEWDKDWGFLVEKRLIYLDDPTKTMNLHEKIDVLNDKLSNAKDKKYITTSQDYGTGKSLELFKEPAFNKRKNKEIKPQDRKPKKA